MDEKDRLAFGCTVMAVFWLTVWVVYMIRDRKCQTQRSCSR